MQLWVQESEKGRRETTWGCMEKTREVHGVPGLGQCLQQHKEETVPEMRSQGSKQK